MTKLTIFKQSVLDFKGNCSIVIPNKFTPFILMNCINLLAGYRGALSSLSGSCTLSTLVTTYRAVLQWLHEWLLGVSVRDRRAASIEESPWIASHTCVVSGQACTDGIARQGEHVSGRTLHLKILYFRFVQENKIFTVQIFRDLPSKFVVLLQTGNKPY